MATATYLITSEAETGFVLRGYGSFAEAKAAAAAIALETRKSVGYDDRGMYKTIGGFATQGHSILAIADLGADEVALVGDIEAGEIKTVKV